MSKTGIRALSLQLPILALVLLVPIASAACWQDSGTDQPDSKAVKTNTTEEAEEPAPKTEGTEGAADRDSESTNPRPLPGDRLLNVGAILKVGGRDLQVDSKLELASSCLKEGVEIYKCEDFTHLDSSWCGLIVRSAEGANEGENEVGSATPPWRITVGGTNILVDAIIRSVTDLWRHVVRVSSAEHALALVDIVTPLGEQSRRVDESKLSEEALSGIGSILHPSKVQALDDNSRFILGLNYAMVPRTGVSHDTFSAFYRVRIQIAATGEFRITDINPYLESVDKVDIGWILD